MELFNNSEMAMAAYANLSIGATDESSNLIALKSFDAGGAGMSEAQAIEFAKRYPTVVAVQPDTDSGFSATVFKSADNQLTVAIRGTAGPSDLAEDIDLTTRGAAYRQIVDMYNWWTSASAVAGTAVTQYEYRAVDEWFEPVPGDVYLFTSDIGSGQDYYLIKKPDTVASGTLHDALTVDSQVDVTGHSLGGHLASAFTALFNNQIDHSYTYNGPGFTNSKANKNFFAALEGVSAEHALTPFDVKNKVTRVQANNAKPGDLQWEFISNLHGGTPGSLTQIPIEDMGDINTGNHSIVTLTDSLAVYGMLGKLDSSLTADTYKSIFYPASNKNESSLEALVDGMEALLGIDSHSLPTDNREKFYQAIYGIEANNLFISPVGIMVHSSADINGTKAKSDFSAFLSLYYLSPIYLEGASGALKNAANTDLNNIWSNGGFDEGYLNHRSDALHVSLTRNTAELDNTTPDDMEVVYYDYSTDTETFFSGGSDAIDSSDDIDHIQIHFGSDKTDDMTGGEKNDFFYGNAGNDTYHFNDHFGHDTVSDADDNDTDIIKVDGNTLNATRVNKMAVNNWDGMYLFLDANGRVIAGKEGWSVIVNGATAIVTTKNADNTFNTITVKDFNAVSNNFGINLVDAVTASAPDTSGLYNVGTGFLGIYTPASGSPKNIYMPLLRETVNNPLYAAQGITWEQYRDIALNFNAATYNYSGGGGISTPFQGSSKNDVLNGSAQSNYLAGMDGDDVIIGDGSITNETSGNADALVGGKGNDKIYGGGGNDVIFSMDLHTTTMDTNTGIGYYGPEASQTSFETLNEHNFINAGDGNDIIEGASYSDTIIAGKGDDRIFAGAGRDLLSGGDGKDTIYADSYLGFIHSKDKLSPSEVGYANAPPIIAIADFIAPDSLRGDYFYSNDTSDIFGSVHYNFNKDNDYNDIIDAGSGDDIVFGEIGSDVISGGADNDTLFGDRSYNTGYFQGSAAGAGYGYIAPLGTTPHQTQKINPQKLSAAYHGNDLIDGGSGNDNIIGGGGDDVLIGGTGDDILFGDISLNIYDVVESTRGEIVVQFSDHLWWGNDTLSGGAGIDYLVGEGGNDVIDGGDDNDYLYGDWYQYQQGTAGKTMSKNDYNTYGGDDAMNGGSGNDFLYGGAGNDTLTGGTGNDTLNGEAGNDTYIVSAGDGVDIITDTLGTNTLKLLGTWLKTGKIEVQQDSINIKIFTSSDHSNYLQMSLADWATFKNPVKNGVGDSLQLQRNVMATGNSSASLNLLDGIITKVETTEDSNNRILIMNNNVDLSLNRLSVTIVDGAASLSIPTISGETIQLLISNWSALTELSENWHTAGFNIDMSDNNINGYDISGKGGMDIIKGGNADEVIHGNDGLDVIDGGGGNDILDGGLGNDTFLFSKADGKDVIINSNSGDIIEFSTGISPADVFITHQDNGDIVLNIIGSSDAICIDRSIDSERLKIIRFHDEPETIWQLDQYIAVSDSLFMCAKNTSQSGGVDGGCIITLDDLMKNDFKGGESSSKNWVLLNAAPISGIQPMSKEQYKNGERGFYFGEFWGKTILAAFPQNGGSAVIGYNIQESDGKGGTTGIIYKGVLRINFDETNTLKGTNSNDFLDGVDATNLILDGGLGDDMINGSSGADTVIHRYGDGNDTLTMQQGNGLQDTLKIFNVDPANVHFSQNHYALDITLTGNQFSETITVNDYFHDIGAHGFWMRYGTLGAIDVYAHEGDAAPSTVFTPDDLLANSAQLNNRFDSMLQTMAVWGADTSPGAISPINDSQNTDTHNSWVTTPIS